MANYTKVDMSAFENAAKEAEKTLNKEAAPSQNSSSTNTFSSPFGFKYVACKSAKQGNNSRVVRFVGAPALQDLSSRREVSGTDAHEIWAEKIYDDSKKHQFILVLPNPDSDEGKTNIIWKIYNKVNMRSWNDSLKKYVKPILTDFPEIDEIVNHCGVDKNAKNYIFAPSWFPKAKLFINCIDRSDSWCKDNKKTKVFCKNISESVGQDGQVTEWSDIGVKASGFEERLLTLASKFGSWESFDTLVTRTGTMQEPWVIKNASRIIEKELDEDIPVSFPVDEFKSQVVLGDITDEELSYERFDFDTIKVTTPKVLKEKLGQSIRKIDDILGTSFYDELEAQVADMPTEEKVEATPAPTTTEAPTRPVVQEAAPTSRPSPLSTVLPAWEQLTDYEKNLIESAQFVSETNGFKKIDVVYKNKSASLYGCEQCGTLSTAEFTTCPSCGRKFN